MYAIYREQFGRMVLEEDGFLSVAEANEWMKDNIGGAGALGHWEIREEQKPYGVAFLTAPASMTSADIDYWFKRAKELLPGHVVSLA